MLTVNNCKRIASSSILCSLVGGGMCGGSLSSAPRPIASLVVVKNSFINYHSLYLCLPRNGIVLFFSYFFYSFGIRNGIGYRTLVCNIK